MAVSSIAASITDLVIGPAVSWVDEIGTTWVRLTRPTLGLNPTIPLIEAGQVMEPLVSVPIAPQANPAATAAALPDDDPQALRSIAWGLRVSPPIALHPLVDPFDLILAHSERLALPRTRPPA